MRTLKFKSRLRSLPSIIITITSKQPWNTETHTTDQNPPFTNHKPWPFEPVKVKFFVLTGLLRWLTAAKNAIVSWLLNFRIPMFVKSAVRPYNLSPFHLKLKTGPSKSRGMLIKRSQVIGALSTWIFLISTLRVLATVKLVTFNVCSDLNHSFCGKSSDNLKRPVHWISFYTVGECFVKIFYYVSQMFNCIRFAFKSDN